MDRVRWVRGSGFGRRVLGGTTLPMAALTALAAMVVPGERVAAQDVEVRVERQECRCVDPDGNEIENCRCMRTPRAVTFPRIVTGQRILTEPGGWAQAFPEMAPRARIGVWIESDDSGRAAELNGALLSEIQEGGPAEDAGLRAGDIVVALDGTPLTEPLDDAEEEAQLEDDSNAAVQRFVQRVGDLEPGEPVELEVIRDGERITLSVTPESSPTISVFGSTSPEVVISGYMDPENREQLREEMRSAMEEARRGFEEALRAMENSQGDREELRERMREERERLREMEQTVEREMERAMRDRESELAIRVRPEVFEFRGPERGAVAWLNADSIRGQSALAFFSDDPCLTVHEGAGRAFALMGQDSCVDGVEMVELNEDLAEYFDAPGQGVLITEVSEDASLGLRPGDVVTAVDGREVQDPGHLRRILESYGTDEEVRLRVIRQGRELEVLGRRRPE